MGKHIRIWGIIKDSQDNILPNHQVKLLRKQKYHKRYYYRQISSGYSDEKGEYAFYLEDVKNGQYKVIIL